jgi:hypothetical protein
VVLLPTWSVGMVRLYNHAFDNLDDSGRTIFSEGVVAVEPDRIARVWEKVLYDCATSHGARVDT